MSKDKNVIKYNEDQYKILKRCSKNKDLSEWNNYRKNNKGIRIHLEGVDLKEEFLEGANLRSALLTGAVLIETKLKNVDFYNAKLIDVDLRGADLEGQDLTMTYLENVDLMGAILNGVNLKNKDLKGFNLANSHLKCANLKYANLDGANLPGAHLEGVKLGFSNLMNTNLKGAYLEGADLGSTRLDNSDMFGALFKNTSLYAAHLDGANLENILFKEGINNNNHKNFSSFERAHFGNAFFSIHDKCETPEKDIISALSKAEVNNVRFINPVFGRKVRDEAWLHHFKKGHVEEKNLIKIAKRLNKINKYLNNNLPKDNNSVFTKIRIKWYKWRKLINIKKTTAPIKKRILLWLWKISSNYGQSIGRWFSCSLVISLLFAIVYNNYYDPNSVHLAVSSIDPENPFWTFFYYSVVTFTTLGFGDITPISNVMKIIVMIEVFLGYIMLGGLISIFANILARRND